MRRVAGCGGGAPRPEGLVFRRAPLAEGLVFCREREQDRVVRGGWRREREPLENAPRLVCCAPCEKENRY